MKRFLLAPMVLMMVGSSSLFAVTGITVIIITKDGPGGPNSYGSKIEDHDWTGGSHTLKCSGTGYTICKFTVNPLPLPYSTVDEMDQYATSQIDQNITSGS